MKGEQWRLPKLGSDLKKKTKKHMLKVAGVLIPNRDFLQILNVWYGTPSFNLHDTPGLVLPTKKNGILETLV